MAYALPTFLTGRYSRGRGKFGKQYFFVRPDIECKNSSRRVSGFSSDEISDKLEKLVNKWYLPHVNIYGIDGWRIASNNEENALKEYWRICAKEDIKVRKQVKLIESGQTIDATTIQPKKQ